MRHIFCVGLLLCLRPVDARCPIGYFLALDQICTPCATNCATCVLVVSDWGRVVCTLCNAGYYLNPDKTCRPCTVCGPGQAMTSLCDSHNDASCETCQAGQYVRFTGIPWSPYECNSCGGGQYAAPDKQSCLTCKTCSFTEYLTDTNRCNTFRDHVCTACPDNKAVTVRNIASCDTCAAGFFSVRSGVSFTCSRCTDFPCGANPPTFISCVNAERICTVCRGTTPATQCDPGQEPDKTCDGRSTENSKCRDCLAGSERPPGSNSLRCEKCKTGFFKSTQSTANCASCTNKPANSFYVSWGALDATSKDCPW
jgi:hypothetical protein